MNILLLGNTGQLGWELERSLAPLGNVTAIDYPDINLADAEQTERLVKQLQPEGIVNATAYTAVDRAEVERDLAFKINAQAPGILAEQARRLNAVFIHYSTDYVFDGTKGSAYLETDPPNPLNAYGESKLAGERAVEQAGEAFLILRTSWVYSLRRDSFVTKVLSWSRQQPQLRLVSDQVSNPTWARMLAEATAQTLASGGREVYDWILERRGLYHLAGDGFASRLEWGKAILEFDPNRAEQVTREILPAATADFPTPARRPLFSALNCERFTTVFGLKLPPWQRALQLAMQG